LGEVSQAKQFYCQQCKQFQLIDSMLFGQVRLAGLSGAVKNQNIFWAKIAQSPPPRKKLAHMPVFDSVVCQTCTAFSL